MFEREDLKRASIEDASVQTSVCARCLCESTPNVAEIAFGV